MRTLYLGISFIFCVLLSYAQTHELADEYWYKAEALKESENFIEAAEMYLKSADAEKLSSEPRMKDLSVELYMVAYCYDLAEKNEVAIDYYLQSLKIDKNLKRDENASTTLNSLASTYKELKDYDNAILYYEQAVYLQKKLFDHEKWTGYLLEIGKIYQTLGNFQKAYYCYKEAYDGSMILNYKSEHSDEIIEQMKDLQIEWSKVPKFVPNMGHHGAVMCMAISSDGKYLVSGGEDYSIKIWDIKTGGEIRTLTGHKNWVTSLEFTNDGKKLISGSKLGIIKVWDVLSGQKLLNIESLSHECQQLLISPDQSKIVLFGKNDTKIRIYDFATGEELQTIEHINSPGKGCFTPNGEKLLTLDGDMLKFWDFSTYKFLYSGYNGIETVLTAIDISPDGTKILTGDNYGKVVLWDINTQSKIKTMHEHFGRVNSIQFSPNSNNALSVSNDKTIKLWNLESGNMIRSYDEHTTSIHSALFLPDGEQLISLGSYGEFMKLWNVEIPNSLREIKGNRTFIEPIDICNNGKYIITGSYNGTVKMWDLSACSLMKTFTNHNKPVRSIDVSNDQKYVATACNELVRISEIKTGKVIKEFKGFSDIIYSINFSPNGRKIATACYDGSGKVWDIENGEQDFSFSTHKTRVTGVAFGNNNNILYSSGMDGYIRFRDLNSSYPDIDEEYSKEFYDGITTMALSPSNEKIAVGAYIKSYAGEHSYTFAIYDLNTKEIIYRQSIPAMVRSIEFSPDGNWVSLGLYDNSVRIWDINQYIEIKTILGHNGYIGSHKFTSDGKRLITGSEDGTIMVWDIETWDCVATLVSSDDNTKWIIYTPDGYWDGSANCGELLSMVKGMDTYKIDQFAAKTNRPDIIMQRAGFTNSELERYFKKLHKKRLRRLKIIEDELEAELKVPQAKIVNTVVNGKFVTVNLKFSEPDNNLKSYNLFVNDVPLFGSLGKPITGKEIELSEKIELTNNVNKIEASCYNSLGSESFREVTYVNNPQNARGNLYLLAIGVSYYKDASLNLAYAHKDARDLEKLALSMKGKGYENVFTKTLTNEQVNLANIKAAKDFVKDAKPDDTFILFIAGHGMHDTDEEATYYYLTHNTDLKNLKGTAATFETIEDLLQGIPPRNKLFLMDACESGELDPEEETYYLASATEAGVHSRGFKKTLSGTALNHELSTLNQKRSFLHEKDRYIYNDLVRRSGAIVFSSSKGGELSYERNDIENGLFTEYIMRALTTTEADADKDGTVSTDELRTYVSEQVAKASGGLQHPTVDRDNIYQKFGFRIE